jgi:hypothetical protein
MREARFSKALAPTGAVAAALATLACCLPWGIGAALGTIGLSYFFARFQVWFLTVSVALLLFGLFQILRKGNACRRRSRMEIALWSIAAVVVVAVVAFPQWIAGLLVGHLR